MPDPNFFGGTPQIAGADKERHDIDHSGHPFGVVNDDRGWANYRCAGLADMAQAIAEGRQHRCNIDVAVHAVEVMTGVLKAAEAGQFLEMTTTCERPDALSGDEARALLV